MLTRFKKKRAAQQEEILTTPYSSTHYVPWIIALLVFLLTLVLAGASSLGLSLQKWHFGMHHKVTIEIPVSTEQDRQRILPQALSALKETPGVIAADPVSNQHILSVLEPWVGPVDLLQDLPLPILIDVKTQPNAEINWSQITSFLRQFSAGARLEHHSRWEDSLILLRTALQVIAYVFAALIMLTVIVTVTLITKSGMDTHLDDIRILRLLGAKTSYIGRQFQAQAFRLSARGALIGFGFALPTIALLSWLTYVLGVPELLRPIADLRLFFLLFLIPTLVIILSMIVARLAVRRMLMKML